MPANFLHGVETLEITAGTTPITVVKSAVIGLIGVAPIGAAQTLTLVNSRRDAEQFGELLLDFNIPQALDAIYDQGQAGTVLVINVYDAATHNASESGESHTPENNAIKLNYAPLDNLVLTNGASHTYTLGDDYEVDTFGNIKLKGAAVLGIDEVIATGSVTITGGTSTPGTNKITALTVNGVDILGAAVDWTTSNAATAALIAAQIVTYTSTPEYTVSVVGAVITIRPLAGVGAAANGFVINAVEAGDVTTTTVNMAGGVTAVAPATVIEADYDRFDPSTVTNAHLIGTHNTTTDVRTGMKLWDLAFTLFGFKPKILIAPGYSTIQAIATELTTYANAYKAVALIDAPQSTTIQEAIEGRGPAGTINFNVADQRVVLLYPHAKVYHADSDADILQPFSQFYAGVMAVTDLNEGYHVSPSNHSIAGIVGWERVITSAINDASTDANALNEVGITTYFNSFGTGYKVWGNRSSAWPSETHPVNFVCVRRTADIINESIELAMLPYTDRPIDAAIIDSVRETVNSFIRSLVQRGALIDGRCYFDPSLNPAENIALGQLVFSVEYMPPTPLERITFETRIDTNLLRSLLVS